MADANKTVSVLVVDDSALMRNLIGRIIEESNELTLAGTAMNGLFALQKIPKLKPDVIVLDLEMPEMNGIQFLQKRKEKGIEIPVVVLSSLAKKGAEITMDALHLGASDFILKPTGAGGSDIKNIARHLVHALSAYGLDYRRKQGDVIEERAEPAPLVRSSAAAAVPGEKQAPPITPLKEEKGRPAEPIEIVAIGISTGGPNALREVFTHIDADLPVPVVVVQHMPAGFTAEFAKSLDRISPLSISEAKEGDILEAGRVLIAPGDFHVEVEKRKLAAVATINAGPAINGHRPSADVLFASVAKNYGAASLGVIMTGMGKDGAREIGSIRRAGGLTLGQDKETCVVYGMPKVACENGFIQHVVPLSEIGPRIGQLVKESR